MKQKQDKKYKVRKPSRLLLNAVSIYFRSMYAIKHKLKVDKSGIKGLKPPYIILCNHTSWNDFAIVGSALFPKSANFMGTNIVLRDPLLRVLTKIMGVIHKKVYYPDVIALRRTKYVMDRKGIVVMMPAGDVSIDGSVNYFDAGTPELIRWLNVPVVTLKISGGYLHMPRFAKKTNKGAKIEVEMKILFTQEDIAKKTDKEIYDELYKELDFNDFEWQKQKRLEFGGKKLAEGMHNILFKCPRCEKEFSMQSKSMKVWCEGCGNTVTVNKYFEFEADGDNVCFDNVFEWNKFQKKHIEKEIADPKHSFSVDTEIWRYKRDSKNGYEKRGEGTLTLDRNQVVYKGTFDEEEVEIAKNVERLPNVSMVNCDCIEVTSGDYVDRYFFKDRRQYVKFVLTFNLIRLKYYPYKFK
jgi:1-acyl-sn-glycerol-3-phosphate acyltransferase